MCVFRSVRNSTELVLTTQTWFAYLSWAVLRVCVVRACECLLTESLGETFESFCCVVSHLFVTASLYMLGESGARLIRLFVCWLMQGVHGACVCASLPCLNVCPCISNNSVNTHALPGQGFSRLIWMSLTCVATFRLSNTLRTLRSFSLSPSTFSWSFYWTSLSQIAGFRLGGLGFPC